MIVEIDKNAGFCFGVINAINKAEEALKTESDIVSLGDIVHNSNEVNRLMVQGLKPIEIDEYNQLSNKTVLIRAHGEPPSTYQKAKENNLQIIDATCPVVLKLQQRIKRSYALMMQKNGQIVVFGKKDHPEVIGLLGQTNFNAILISNALDIEKLDFTRSIEIFSQTTMPLDAFIDLKNEIIKRAGNTEIIVHDTVCRQVANRLPNISKFAAQYDVILFVSGNKSSNGKLIFEKCKNTNSRSYFISSVQDIKKEWIEDAERIGISGATSTPQWLMEEIKRNVESTLNID